MTPDQRRDFEQQWPPLARRVEGMLARKGVPACRRDDIRSGDRSQDDSHLGRHRSP